MSDLKAQDPHCVAWALSKAMFAQTFVAHLPNIKLKCCKQRGQDVLKSIA